MGIAYLSLDEVNHDLAARTAGDYGVDLDILTSPAEITASPCEAVIYDLDYLADHDRRHILDELTRGPADTLAVLHSYNLRPGEKRALRRNGVVVHRRLHPSWLGRLMRRKSASTRALQLASALTGIRRASVLLAS
jgi:hypothetical protein